MKPEDRSEMIDRFLQGHMDQKEQEQFQTLLKENPRFQTEFEEQKELFELAGDSDLEDAFSALQANMSREEIINDEDQ